MNSIIISNMPTIKILFYLHTLAVLTVSKVFVARFTSSYLKKCLNHTSYK